MILLAPMCIEEDSISRFDKDNRIFFLRSARAILLDHLAKEDELLYPALNDTKTAKEFSAGMQSISRIITIFFTEQEKSGGIDNPYTTRTFPK